MKTRNFLWGAMGLLAMASCSNDELVSVNHDGDEIAFNVVTNANTRVATGENGTGGVYCNINRPEKFYVWAATEDGKTYIDGDVLKKFTSYQTLERALISTWYKNQSNTRYWPEGKLHFYAFGNEVKDERIVGTDDTEEGHYTFDWNNGAPKINVSVPTDVYKQKDLLYGVKKNQAKELLAPMDPPSLQNVSTQPGTGIVIGNVKRYKPVQLNFRHALSQVVFTAQNMSPNLYVEVKGVSIGKVKSDGVFIYPSEDTETNNDGHPNRLSSDTSPVVLDEPDYDDTSWGRWESVTNPTTYSVSFDPVSVPGDTDPNTTPTSLTNTAYQYQKTYNPGQADEVTIPETAEYSRDAMLLLPQESTAWVPKADEKPDADTQTGTYLLVECRMFNIAGATFNEATDVCLWGKKVETPAEGADPVITYTHKNIAIPVALDWKQGKKYIYNIIFGTSSKAVDPDDPDEPVLVPINFAVSTVDEFVPGGTNNVPEDPQPAESTITD